MAGKSRNLFCLSNKDVSNMIQDRRPAGQNSPRKPGCWLCAGQLPGTPSTAPQREVRLNIDVSHAIVCNTSAVPENGSRQLCGALAEPMPNRQRSDPSPILDMPADSVRGFVTTQSNSETKHSPDTSVQQYSTNYDMHRVFWDANGDLPIVLQPVYLAIGAELASLMISPTEMVTIPWA
jgi:homogentisate 1,2-dioxygenase